VTTCFYFGRESKRFGILKNVNWIAVLLEVGAACDRTHNTLNGLNLPETRKTQLTIHEPDHDRDGAEHDFGWEGTIERKPPTWVGGRHLARVEQSNV